MSNLRYFTPDFIETVKDANDLVAVASETVKLKRTGVNYQGCCPFHEDKSPSFSIHQSKQTYTCFTGCAGSGGSGDVFEFVMRRDSIEFAEAVALLAKRAGLELPSAKQIEKSPAQLEREATISSFQKVFRDLASSNAQDFEQLLKQLDLDADALTKLGFELGYTDSVSSELRSAYSSETEDVIKRAKVIGILDAKGDPFFSDKSITLNLKTPNGTGLLFIGQDQKLAFMPLRAQTFNGSLFGVEQFMNNCIESAGGERKYLGKVINIVNSPILALQLLSRGVPNVIAPLNAENLTTDGLSSALTRLYRSFDEVGFRFIVPHHEHTESSALFRFAVDNTHYALPSIIEDQGCSSAELANLLSLANREYSLEQAFSISKPSQSVYVLSPADLVIKRATGKAIKATGIKSQSDILGTKRQPFLLELLSNIQAISPADCVERISLLALSKFGFSEHDYQEVTHPGLSAASSKRAELYQSLLGCTILDKRFSQLIAGSSEGLPNDQLPTYLFPHERLNLALISSFSLEKFDAGICDQNGYVKSFAKEFYSDDTHQQNELNKVILRTIRKCKTLGLHPYELGNKAMTELALFDSDATYPLDLMTLTNTASNAHNNSLIDIAPNLIQTETKAARNL